MLRPGVYVVTLSRHGCGTVASATLHVHHGSLNHCALTYDDCRDSPRVCRLDHMWDAGEETWNIKALMKARSRHKAFATQRKDQRVDAAHQGPASRP